MGDGCPVPYTNVDDLCLVGLGGWWADDLFLAAHADDSNENSEFGCLGIPSDTGHDVSLFGDLGYEKSNLRII